MTLHSIYSTQTSRYERLNYFSQSIEKGEGRKLAFLSLDKKDRITLLALCKFKGSTVSWKKIGKETLRNAVQHLLHGPKLPNLLQLPPQEMTKAHLSPFLTLEDLANLQTTYKAAPELSNASLIIKNYSLTPLIARYCHQDSEILSEGGKIKVLNQLMSFAKDLSKLEHLAMPTYQSIGKFFELIEARNLIRMVAKMHQKRPLIGIGLEAAQLKISKDSASTQQRAEKVRAWFGQHHADLQAFVQLNLNNCNLTLLPPEIGQLRALTDLWLYNNRLTSLPKEIGQLRALALLDLDNNRLTNLPKEIGQLKALITLMSDNNRLSGLPPEIGQFKVLSNLFVQNNRLISLPKEIRQIMTLRTVSLSKNGLVELPDNLKRFGEQLKQQCKTLQMQTLLGRLRKCLSGKHDCKGIAVLLDKMEKFQGKKIRSKLHAHMQEVCKKEKSLRKKVNSSQFGRTALIDPTIDPKLKLAALKRFERLYTS